MTHEVTALAPAKTQEVVQWAGAVPRAAEAKRERDEFISSILVDGIDYGVIPGTEKRCLFKAGAEKVGDAFNLWPDYTIETETEDWDKPLFYYKIRCHLKQRGTDVIVASGMGSCNSMETKYRWREGKRACPECGAEAIIKGHEKYGGGWVCWAKRGGCGAKFIDEAPAIIGQKVGRVPNPDVFDQVNTILKMAKKRARVAAALDLGLSDQFTQDMEEHVEKKDKPESVDAEIVHEEPPHTVEDAAPDNPSDTPCVTIGKHKGEPLSEQDDGFIDWHMRAAKDNLDGEDYQEGGKKHHYRQEKIDWLAALKAEAVRRASQ